MRPWFYPFLRGDNKGNDDSRVLDYEGEHPLDAVSVLQKGGHQGRGGGEVLARATGWLRCRQFLIFCTHGQTISESASFIGCLLYRLLQRQRVALCPGRLEGHLIELRA